MNEENALIVTDSGETTELSAPNFGDGLSFLNPEEMPDLEAAEPGMSIEPKYLEFKSEGQSVRAIFNGMTSIKTKNRQTGELEDKPAVVLQNKDGIFLNAGASLVNQMARLLPGSPLEVKFIGTEKTGSGNNVNKFDVRLLNIKVNMPRPSAPQKPAQSAQSSQPKKDWITLFWSRANELKLTNIESDQILQEHNRNFEAAYNSIAPF